MLDGVLVLLFLFLSSHSCLLILVTLAMECLFMYGWNLFMYEMMDGTCLCNMYGWNLLMDLLMNACEIHELAYECL